MLPDASTLLHWVGVYGYPFLGVILLLAAAGMPVPIELVLLALGGLSATRGGPGFLALFALGVGTTVVGDALDYGIGRLMREQGLAGLPGRRIWGRWRRRPDGAISVRSEEKLRRLAGWCGSGVMIFLSRCVLTPLEAPLSLLAGATRMPFARFLVWDALGEVVYVLGYLALGYTGAASLATSGPLRIVVWGAILLAMLGPLVVVSLMARKGSLTPSPVPPPLSSKLPFGGSLAGAAGSAPTLCAERGAVEGRLATERDGRHERAA